MSETTQLEANQIPTEDGPLPDDADDHEAIIDRAVDETGLDRDIVEHAYELQEIDDRALDTRAPEPRSRVEQLLADTSASLSRAYALVTHDGDFPYKATIESVEPSSRRNGRLQITFACTRSGTHLDKTVTLPQDRPLERDNDLYRICRSAGVSPSTPSNLENRNVMVPIAQAKSSYGTLRLDLPPADDGLGTRLLYLRRRIGLRCKTVDLDSQDEFFVPTRRSLFVQALLASVLAAAVGTGLFTTGGFTLYAIIAFVLYAYFTLANR